MVTGLSYFSQPISIASQVRTGWITHIPVIFACLEIAQRSGAPRRIRHDPQSSIHLPLLPKLPKHPPNALHERRVERLVPRLEIDPPSHPLNRVLPLSSVPHNDLPTSSIVLVNPQSHDIRLALDAEGFVYLVFDGKAMGIPTKATLDMMSGRMSMPSDYVLRPKISESSSYYSE